MRLNKSIVVATISIWMVGCTSVVIVPVDYTPTTTARQSNGSVVTVGEFEDKRGEDAKYLGAVRGGFGNPLKTITASEPVSALVTHAFEKGLAARGMLSASASKSFVLSGTVKQLYTDRYVRIEADADVELRLVDSQNRQVFQKDYQGKNITGSGLALNTGIFADPDELRVAVSKVLSEVVDQALDDPEFIRALQSH